MTTQLELYNNALTKHIGERPLSSLTENRKPRRVLDQVWDSGFVKSVLELGQWKFAIRAFQSEFSPALTPDFGFQYAHDKPCDWVRTTAISLSDYFTDPLLSYNDEANYWFVDAPQIWVKMVSDDPVYGGNLTNWTESFVSFAECKLAAEVCLTLTQDRELCKDLDDEGEKLLKKARELDAIADPPKFTPMGSWARSRMRTGRRGPPSNIRTL